MTLIAPSRRSSARQQRLQNAGEPAFMSQSHIALVRAAKRIQVKRESINDK